VIGTEVEHLLGFADAANERSGELVSRNLFFPLVMITLVPCLVPPEINRILIFPPANPLHNKRCFSPALGRDPWRVVVCANQQAREVAHA
jgi:hypothetical protein